MDANCPDAMKEFEEKKAGRGEPLRDQVKCPACMDANCPAYKKTMIELEEKKAGRGGWKCPACKLGDCLVLKPFISDIEEYVTENGGTENGGSESSSGTPSSRDQNTQNDIHETAVKLAKQMVPLRSPLMVRVIATDIPRRRSLSPATPNCEGGTNETRKTNPDVSSDSSELAPEGQLRRLMLCYTCTNNTVDVFGKTNGNSTLAMKGYWSYDGIVTLVGNEVAAAESSACVCVGTQTDRF